jgi:anti-sigma B factor antagonist
VERSCEVRIGPCVDGHGVLFVTGDLDTWCGPRLEQGLAELRSSGARTITIDVTGLDFIDSTGLGVLVRARDALRSDLGRLEVESPPDHIRRVFELAGLTDLLTGEPD